MYYCAWRAPGVGLTHDDGIYVVTAKALATGKGYTIISLPSEIRQTKYPILFPLLLSFIWRAAPSFPANVPFLKLVPLLATLFWALGVYRLARELSMNTLWALFASLCVATNQWVVSFSGLLRSETLFAALATWAVVYLLRAERSGEIGPAVWAAVLAGAAYHTRTAALPILAGGVLGLLLMRRYRLAFTFGAIAGALCLPWVIWQAQQASLPPVERYYTSLGYAQENILSYFTGHEKAVILRDNLRQILIAPSSLFGLAPGLITLACCLLFWGACAIGALRVKSRSLQLALTLSVLLPALWSWAPARFLFPALGMLLAAASTVRGRAVALGLAAVLAANAVSLRSVWRDSQATGPFLAEFGRSPSTWTEVTQVMRWIRSHSGPDDIVISAVDPMVYLYTGLKSVRGFYVDALPVYYGLPPHENSDQEFHRVLAQYRPRYVLQTHPDFYEEAFLWPTTKRLLAEGGLREEYRAGAMHVYAVQPFLEAQSAKP
jgi:hypothetical protein